MCPHTYKRIHMNDDKNPLSWNSDVWLFAIGMAFIGGVANIVAKLQRPRAKPYCFLEMLAELVVSSAVGTVSFMAIYSFDVPIGAAYAGGCAAGHMGTRLLFLAENYVTRKFDHD